RDTLQRRRIDLDAKSWLRQRGRLAAATEGDVARTECLAHQVVIIGAFEIAQVGDAGGEVPAGRRQQRRLADLAAELASQAVPAGELDQPQRRQEAAALRQADV